MSAIPAMSVPAAANPATTVTGATGAGPDRTIGEVFSALVDALTAGLGAAGQATVGDLHGTDTETGAEPAPAVTDDATTVAADGTDPADAVVAAAAVMIAWPPATTPGVVGGAGEGAEGAQPSAAAPAGGAAGAATGADEVTALLGDASESDAPTTGAPTTEEPAADELVEGLEGADPAAEPDVEGVTEALSGDSEGTPANAAEEPAVEARPSLAAAASPGPAGETEGATAGAQRVNAPAPVAATAEPGAATPTRTAAPALPEQLVEVLGPLRRGPDGSHRVAIQLRPDDLGEVLVDVRVRGNEINLSLRADLPGTADLLRDALADLRRELEAAGFRSGELDVGAHGDGREARERASDRAAERAARGAADDTVDDGIAARDEHADTALSATSTTGLDVRI